MFGLGLSGTPQEALTTFNRAVSKGISSRTKTAGSMTLEQFGDFATAVAGGASPLVAAAVSGVTDPGENPIRTGLVSGMGSLGGGLAGGLAGAAVGAGLGKLYGVVADGDDDGMFFGTGEDHKKYMSSGARISALIGALGTGAAAALAARRASMAAANKDTPPAVSRK